MQNLNQTAPVTRSPQIEEALGELSRVIERSGEIQVELEARLQTVLLPRLEPTEGSNQSQPEPVRARLAQILAA